MLLTLTPIGTAQDRDLVSVEGRGKTNISPHEFNISALPDRNKRFALLVGVSKYLESNITEVSGAKDTEVLAQALTQYAGFPEDQVIRLASDLTDKTRLPTRANILKWLSAMKLKVPQDGLFLFSFSGHGIEHDRIVYLAPYDVTLDMGDLSLLRDTAIDLPRVRQDIEEIKCKQVIFLIDACRSKPPTKGTRGITAPTMSESYRVEFDTINKSVQAYAILYAAKSGQQAIENPELNEGIFTQAIVEGLQGGNKGDLANDRGEITLARLKGYIDDRVKNLSFGLRHDQQPWTDIQGYKAEDLVIASVASLRKGRFSVVTNPPGAAVVVKKGQEIYRQGVSNKETGYFAITDILWGSYIAEVNAPDYVPFSQEFKISAQQTEFATRADMQPALVSMTVLVPAGIQSLPAFFLDQQRVAPERIHKLSNGTLEISKVNPGKHQLKVEHPEIEPAVQEVTVVGRGPNVFVVDVKRIPLAGRVVITGTPPGAKGSVRDSKGEFKKEVALSNNLLQADLPRGQFILKLEAEGYVSRDVPFSLEGGGTAFLEGKMVPSHGTLLLYNPMAKLPEVILDGNPVPPNALIQKTENLIQVEVKPGLHSIRISHPELEPLAKTVQVEPGDQTHLSLQPKKVELRPASGNLIAYVDPPTASIFLKSSDGGFRRETSLRDGIFRMELPPGSYQIEVKAPEYSTQINTFDIRAGEVVPLTARLAQSSGTISLVGAIQGITQVSLDGKVISLDQLIPKSDEQLDLVKIAEGGHTLEIKGANTAPMTKHFQVVGGKAVFMPVEQLQPQSFAKTGLLIVSTGIKEALVEVSPTGQISPPLQAKSLGGIFQKELPPGNYQIEISQAGYKTEQVTTTIVAGKNQLVTAHLEPITGSIRIYGQFDTALPAIQLDGKNIDSREWRRGAELIEVPNLPVGLHQIQIEQPGYQTVQKSVSVVGGDFAFVTLAQAASTATFAVVSEPGAYVYIDNQIRGAVRVSGRSDPIEIPPGEYSIGVKKDDFSPNEARIMLKAGTNPPVSLSMRRVRVEQEEFLEDFSQEKANWTSPETWKVDRGKMQIAGLGKAILRDRIYQDFEWIFMVQLLEKETASWMLRQKDERNYYLFRLYGHHADPHLRDSLQAFVCRNGELKPVQSQKIPMDVGASGGWVRIRVRAMGKRIEHDIEMTGEFIPAHRLQDVLFDKGSIGFASQDGEQFLVGGIHVVPFGQATAGKSTPVMSGR
jgi:hypothetical protein